MKLFSRIFVTTLFFLFFTAVQAEAQSSSPVFEVRAPKPDQTLYGNKLPILFKVENVQLVNKEPTEKLVAGEGHILLWLDDENPTAETATKVTADTFVYSDVPFGNHTLKAELTTTDNKPLTPPQTYTISFKTEAVPSQEDPAISSSFDKTTAVVILGVVALVILAAWWYTKDDDDEMIPSPKTLDKTIKKSTKKTNRSKTKKKK